MNDLTPQPVKPAGLTCACGGKPACGPDGAFDPRRIRADFPILNVPVHQGKSLVYLDNAATTQKPTGVICAVCDYYQLCNANVHRSLHYLGEQATRQFEEARGKLAAFLHAPDARQVIFTRGTTEAINLVMQGWGRKFIGAGDEILCTEMEHHSNLVPWQVLARERQATLRFIPVREDGTLDLAAYEAMLSPKVKLVTFTHASNVLGTINPARAIIAAARRVGAATLVDAAQSVPHLPVDVQELDCDFLAFSGHKMLGPTGIGVLYGRAERLEAMDPFMYGGEMINKVTYETATWAELPHKLEAGTPHISGAIALGAAVDYLTRVGLPQVQRYVHELTEYGLAQLGRISGLRIFGRAPERSGAISFALDDLHPHDLSQLVDREGIAIRAGHLCAQPLMRKLGVPAVSRASLYLYNLTEEIDRLVEAIAKARAFFHHGN